MMQSLFLIILLMGVLNHPPRRCCAERTIEHMHAMIVLATCSNPRQHCILLSYGAIIRNAVTSRVQAYDDEERKLYVSYMAIDVEITRFKF